MLVKQAKALVAQWVIEEASKTPGFFGAYFAGSSNWMSDDAFFPATSDVDIKIVTEEPPEGFQKFLYHDVMIEVSYIGNDQFQSPDTILGTYHAAGHFTNAHTIIADPTGQLHTIQASVSRDYAKREWVYKRCENARDWFLTSLQWLDEAEPLHEQAFACLYAAGIPNHILLVADLQNPTVRRMFVASRDVLAKYQQLELHESLLRALGSDTMSQAQVSDLLDACAEVFDSAKLIVKTPFFGASSISDGARPLAIDGSRELIARGDYREAAFWVAMMHSWCEQALFNDAPAELQRRFTPSYHHLLSQFGLLSFAERQQRTAAIRDLLPRIWEVTETIIATNPAIHN